MALSSVLTAQPPAITTRTASGLTVLFTLLYVAPFYISPTLRSNSLANRNTPSVIRARIRAVVWSCIACILITVSVLYTLGNASPDQILHLLGLYPASAIDTVKSCSLLAILFAGPLFERGIVEGEYKTWGRWATIKETVYDDLIGYRNFVVGPASEELVFRSLTISLFILAKTSSLRITFTTPLIFGLAHLHHLHEWVNAHRRRPDASYLRTLLTPQILLPGLLRSTFQFLYTSLFGFIAAFVYVRTANLWACVLTHAFCNWMGLPRFWGRVGQELGEEAAGAGDGSGGGGGGGGAVQAGPPGQKLGLGWTLAYYVVLVAGAVGFWESRWVLTESGNALAGF